VEGHGELNICSVKDTQMCRCGNLWFKEIEAIPRVGIMLIPRVGITSLRRYPREKKAEDGKIAHGENPKNKGRKRSTECLSERVVEASRLPLKAVGSPG
jgi:hypothetical protein